MELVIIYFLIPLGLTIFAIVYSSIHKTAGERTKNFNFQKTSNKQYSMNNYDNDDKKTILKMIGFIGAVIITVFIISKLWTSNPIIGKWQSETKIPFMGKMINEIEFTKNRAYSMGIMSNVDYEIDGNKIIVTDGLGIGVVYEIIDKDTMKNNMLGMQTVYKRIR